MVTNTPQDRSAAGEPPSSSLSILVVDDDALVREVTAGMLADAGHQVQEAPDGASALRLLMEKGPVDLLITDIGMPTMDGVELARQVKGQWPDLPVVLVSGRAQPPGTLAFVSKPFSWTTLVQAVSRVAPSRHRKDPHRPCPP